MSRHISNTFLNDLRTGPLQSILTFIHKDTTLDLELRGDKVIIYYRGLKLLSIIEKNSSNYSYEILDKNYIGDDKTIYDINPEKDFKEYVKEAKYLINKYEKDCWEKDIQQSIVRENNYTPNAKGTDFYCIDMEYEEPCEQYGRADIVALKWDATVTAHKQKNPDVKIYMIEVKQGEDAISSDNESSGLKKHYDDFIKFNNDKEKSALFIKDMIEVFKQKYRLGLIDINYNAIEPTPGTIKDFNVSPRLEMAFVLANYKHRSSSFSTELQRFTAEERKNLKFFTSCFMGYGLYSEFITTADDLLEHCKS